MAVCNIVRLLVVDMLMSDKRITQHMQVANTHSSRGNTLDTWRYGVLLMYKSAEMDLRTTRAC